MGGERSQLVGDLWMKQVDIWHAGHPGLATIDGRLVIVPQWMLDVAYRPILTHHSREPIVPGMWDNDFETGDRMLKGLLQAHAIRGVAA